MITPFDIVVSMSPSTTTPALGGTLRFTLTTTPAPNFVITGTTWTYTVTYNGFTSATLTPQSPGLLNATVYLSVPGMYTVTAVTTYMDSNPSGPRHSPTTVTSLVDVPPPSAITKDGGIDTPIAWTAADLLTDDIATPNGPLGSFAAGLFQENLTNVFTTISITFAQGWGPSVYGLSWNVTAPHLYDSVGVPGMTAAQWAAIPVGTAYVAYTQELQYTWEMSTNQGQESFTVGLPALNWMWTKVDATHWEVQ